MSNRRWECLCVCVSSQFIHCLSTPITEKFLFSPHFPLSALSCYVCELKSSPLQAAVTIAVGMAVPYMSGTRCLTQVDKWEKSPLFISKHMFNSDVIQGIHRYTMYTYFSSQHCLIPSDTHNWVVFLTSLCCVCCVWPLSVCQQFL